MRIDPEQQTITRARQTETSTRTADQGFASTLAAARNANAADATRPAAEQWGQWGRGATPAGFGPAPDPAQFAHHETGPGTPAHPLNSRGNTAPNSAFTVPGYTVRGTPIPPGFYNLAYYNQYLREGGTPLVGFEAYDPANGSLTDVYGSFGDGRERATSFVGGLVNETTPAASTVSVASSTAASAPSEAAPAPTAAEPAATVVPAAAPAPTAPSGDTPATTAPAPTEALPADDASLVAEAANRAVRLALQNLLDDLLRLA